MQLKSGTILFNGSNNNWYSSGSVPHEDKEIGGSLFSLNTTASPKLRNAQYIGVYKLAWELDVTECASPAEMEKALKDGADAVYCETEAQLAIPIDTVGDYVEFVESGTGTAIASKYSHLASYTPT